jgi:hypothetical protein
LKAEWKEKWVQALESGTYEQIQGTLRDATGIHRSFCPIGVLCEIAKAKWSPARSAYLGAVPIAEGGILTAEGEWLFGLDRQQVDTVVVMNDEKNLSLYAIAAYIRANF